MGHDHTEAAAPARCDLAMNTAGYYREAVAAGLDLGTGAHDHVAARDGER